MPYEVGSDSLPANVKKLPDKKQRQWVHVFNSCSADGKAEATCFAMANGVVKKSVKESLAGEPLVAHAFNEVYGSLECDLPDAVIEASEKSYQYVDSYEYESRKMSQEAANYNPVGGTGTQACSNCMFFVSPARCTVVSGEIAPNGLSNQWRAVPKPEMVPMPVVIVGGDYKSVGTSSSAGVLSFRSLVERIKGWTGGSNETVRASRLLTSRDTDPQGIIVVKQADGKLRWFSKYSNAWQDRDGEIITEASHKEYTDWVWQTKNFPELWVWHTPNTRFGVADWVDFTDGFACASGLIDDTPAAKAVVDYLATKEAGSIGVSHGFLSIQDGKYITKHRTFEISVLPQERASVWTADFAVTASSKETMMAFDPTRRNFLVGALGEEAVKSLEANAETAAAGLKQLGVDYKETPAASATAGSAPAAASLTAAAPAAATATPTVAAAGAKAFAGPDGMQFVVSESGLVVKMKDGTEQVLQPVVEAQKATPLQLADNAGYQALAGLMSEFAGSIRGLTESVLAIQKEVKELKQSDDDKIASAFATRALPATGYRASEANANGVTQSEKEAIAAVAGTAGAGEDFFSQMIKSNLGGVTFSGAAAAAAGVGTPAAGTVTVG